MIAEFCVRNFNSIRSEQKLSFVPSNDQIMIEDYSHQVTEDVKLLKLGIIYGSNASGKSNVLKSLDFFRRIMVVAPQEKSQELDYTPFLFDEHSKTEHSFMSMVMYLNGVKFILKVEFDCQRIYEESLTSYKASRPALLYNRYYNEETDSAEVEFSATLKLPKSNQRTIIGNTINNSTVMAAFGKSNVESSLLNDVFHFFAYTLAETLTPSQSLTDIVKENMAKDIDGELKQFILYFLKASDFNISDLSFDRKNFSFRHRTDEGNYEMDESLESQGTIRFLGLGNLLYQLLAKDKFIAIDEVETSIHYELVSYFIKSFLANSEGESQLLLTTHDINLLSEDFIRRDTIWFTDKDNNAETHIERLSSMGLHKNLSPYNAYQQGKLVKLPFLGSIYYDLSILPKNEEN